MFLSLTKLQHGVQLASHFVVTADVTPNHPQKERLKVAFRSMFLRGIESQRFMAYLFPSFTTHSQKIPLLPLGLSYAEQKNTFKIHRNSARCSYHTDLSRFVPLVSIEYLTMCWPGYAQNSEFPQLIDPKQTSCRNVRIWRKRTAVRRKCRGHLKKCFGMKMGAAHWPKRMEADQDCHTVQFFGTKNRC